MNQERTVGTGRLASSVGLVAVASPLCLATFFAVGGPFGTLNDVGNAAVGVLSAALAWRLREALDDGVRGPALAAAGAGAALTVIGSTLVVSRTTGFLFASLVSSVGFAAMGAWLIALNSGARTRSWSTGLRRLGLAAGALMALGVVALPGIAQRLDDMAAAPAWLWIAFLGWLGIFVVYPAWAIWLGARGASAQYSRVPTSS